MLLIVRFRAREKAPRGVEFRTDDVADQEEVPVDGVRGDVVLVRRLSQKVHSA